MNQMATMRILWAFLTSSAGLFAVVILVSPPAAATPNQLHLAVFVAFAAAMAATSFVLPRQLHAQAVKGAGALEIEEIPDPDAPSGFAGAKRVKVFKDPARVKQHALRLYQLYMIIGCAISETVAMLGVILDRLGHPPTTTLPFVFAGTFLLGLRYPVEGKALELFQGVAKARLS